MKTKFKIYLTLLAFSGASLALIFFLIMPTFSDIKEGSLEILSSRKEALFLKMQSNELSQLKEDLEIYGTNLDKLDKSFVDAANPIDFIEFLENTASSLGIEVKINLTAKTSFFNIYAEGDFNNLLKFSEKLEAGSYLLKINSLSLRKSQDGKTAADFHLEVINKQ